MSVLSSKLRCHFLTNKAQDLEVMEVELYSIQIFVLGGKKLNKTENEREKK